MLKNVNGTVSVNHLFVQTTELNLLLLFTKFMIQTINLVISSVIQTTNNLITRLLEVNCTSTNVKVLDVEVLCLSSMFYNSQRYVSRI